MLKFNKKRDLTESTWSIFAIVRFSLASIVFFSHIPHFVNCPSIFQNVIVLGGKASVVGFLLISGFSIEQSYKKSSKAFFTRRFLRIYPLYFFAILFAVVMQGYEINNMSTAGWLTSIANFFFLQTFLAVTITYNGPLWSLGVEAFFYLLVPIFAKLSNKQFLVIIITSMLLYSLTYYVIERHLWGYTAYMYAWPWLIGFLISRGNNIYISIILLLLGTLVVYNNKIIAPESLSWVTYLIVATLILVVGHTNLKLNEGVRRIFNFFGDISYPLYLFHYPLFILLVYLGMVNAWAYVMIAYLIVVPLNYLLDHWLKNIFWKPVVVFINANISTYKFRLQRKTSIVIRGKVKA